MSAAYDIATLIDTSVPRLAIMGTNLGVNTFLDKGNNEVAVFEFSGVPDTKAHGQAPAATIEHPKIQLQVRNSSNKDGWNLCYAIYRYLLQPARFDALVNAHKYDYIESLVYPHILVRDELNRTIYLAELQVHRGPEGS